MKNSKFNKEELMHFIEMYKNLYKISPLISELRCFINGLIDDKNADEKFRTSTDSALVYYINSCGLKEYIRTRTTKKDNAKRFSKDELIEYINSLTNELDRMPSVLELTEYINRQYRLDDFNSYEEYMLYYLKESTIKYYINCYDLSDVVNIRKNKRK